MNKKIIWSMLMFASVLLVGLVSAQPPTFHQFYGRVLDVNGTLIEESGLEIKASVDSEIKGVGLSDANSQYGYSQLFFVYNGQEGDTISFSVNDFPSSDYTFTNEATTELDLTLSCLDLDGDSYGLGCDAGEDCDDTNSELNTDCTPPADDGGGSPDTGGPSGGSSRSNRRQTTTQISTCAEDWQCTKWGECTNRFQARNCAELNSCNTTIEKPIGIQPCQVEKSETEESPQEKSAPKKGKLTLKDLFMKYIYLVIAIALILIIILILILRKSLSKHRIKKFKKNRKHKGFAFYDL
tara:strand:- start:442 stop:1329 length:888 start_codon:yes stop_codon:yes gene_type:complete